MSEMVDTRNRVLAEITRTDDFIVSDELVSLMLAQISENKYLSAVFADLFDPEGSEIYLKSIMDYITLDAPVNFFTLVQAARERDEVAVGFRRSSAAEVASQHYGIVINPRKKDLITFELGDSLVVLAEE
ncbi:MAG: hypothetical protein AB1894_06550 [Chloroflexota bacterium]